MARIAGDHRARAGHVELHARHLPGGLDVEAAGVERDALAHQRQVRLGAAGRVAEPHQPRAARGAAADGQDAAVAAALEGLLVEDLHRDPLVADVGPRGLGERLRVEEVGGSVAPVAGLADGVGRGLRPRHRVLLRRAHHRRHQGDRRHRRRLVRCRDGLEQVGAEQRPLAGGLQQLRVRHLERDGHLQARGVRQFRDLPQRRAHRDPHAVGRDVGVAEAHHRDPCAVDGGQEGDLLALGRRAERGRQVRDAAAIGLRARLVEVAHEADDGPAGLVDGHEAEDDDVAPLGSDLVRVRFGLMRLTRPAYRVGSWGVPRRRVPLPA